MKKFLLLSLLFFYCFSCPAQLLDRIKNKMEQKVVDQIDQSIDKATQKKKRTEKPVETESTCKTQPENTESQSEIATTETQTSASVKTSDDITAYSKFDFVQGSRIILHEDFSQDAVGDFPANWNTRSGAELVNIDGKSGKWLRFNQGGVFYSEGLTDNLPENFTLQMDLIASKSVSNIGEFMISIMQTNDMDQKFDWGNASQVSTPSFKISFQPTSTEKGQLKYSSNLIGSQYKHGVPEFNKNKNSTRISIWRQKQRVRVYLDSTKVLDLPRALDAAEPLNTLTFTAINPDFSQMGGAFYLANIQLAVGVADTRNKLLTEGKFTTSGILFDVNSDKILPQSYGSIKEIAHVLKESAALKVKIVGHTDSDGNEGDNESLSKRRAVAVKETLKSEFGIDASRLDTDGKGETDPVDTNDTPVGKANNRRVEFIKL